jgi:hypothetical protein
METLIRSRIFWGSMLVLGGVLALLDNLGFVRIADLFWVIIAAFISAFFVGLFIKQDRNWWWLIPGLLFAGIASGILLNWLIPSFGSQWSAPVVLFFLGISFFIIYFAEREHWWTILLGGTVLAIGFLAGITSLLSDSQGIGLFIIGMGVSFTLVAILPTPVGSMHWAWIPAGILYVSGIIFMVSKGMVLFYITPLLIIILGAILVFVHMKQSSRKQV